MRKFLLSALTLTGIAVASQLAGAAPAEARPVFVPGHTASFTEPGLVQPGLIQTVQYHDWRRNERHRRFEERRRWRRHHDWQRHRGYYHGN